MALRELHTALIRQFDPSYEDYTAIDGVNWGSNAVPAVGLASSTPETPSPTPAEPTPPLTQTPSLPPAGLTPPPTETPNPLLARLPASSTEIHILHPAPKATDLIPPRAKRSKGRKKVDIDVKERVLEHLDAFFSEYPQFRRDPTESVATQLNQLRRQESWWGHRHSLWDNALSKYQEALVLQFNASYGTDENDLATWHRLLARLPVEHMPKTVHECKLVCIYLKRAKRYSRSTPCTLTLSIWLR